MTTKTTQPGKIRKLEESVINRIAAGEVIQRPSNALKELLENSLDAGATNIQVSTKSGGLKVLQIQDNGCGVSKADLPILCERFTTSKLQKFEDLEEIATFGFRGEALASISHVAHLTITTKTDDTTCAYKAEYSDGQLKVHPDGMANPKACAGNKGTIICVEDLFYNMDTRRRALKSPSEEHNKILEVVNRYAVHNPTVGFSVKKIGESNVDIRTSSGSTTIDNIRILFGGQISRELLEVKYEDCQHFKMKGYVSNVNFSTKKSIFILFINNRLVECTAIRKAVDAVYTSYLPKGSHPFLYLSIEINPRNVDVNVHPTKHEVHFLHEDIIVSNIASAIESLLLGSNQSRTFFVQSLLPGASVVETSVGSSVKRTKKLETRAEASKTFNGDSTFSNSKSTTQVDPKKLVRTDTALQKLDRFLTSAPAESDKSSDPIELESNDSNTSNISKNQSKPKNEYPKTCKDIMTPVSSDGSSTKRREIRLKSVKTLLGNIDADCHNDLLNVFRNHTFVGCVDRTRALIQHETKLYLINSSRLSVEFFYQRILREFGNFGRITIEDSLTIKELVMMVLQAQGEDDESNEVAVNRSVTARKFQELLLSKAKMLDDYFALKFDSDGRIKTIPLILENYFPSMDELPKYMQNLAEKVCWTDEIKCFESFAHQTAVFYAVQPGGDDVNDDSTPNGHTWRWTIEHILYPEVKKGFLPPKIFAEDSTVIQLADLPELYKVFERC